MRRSGTTTSTHGR
jgi:hypothetical protein